MTRLINRFIRNTIFSITILCVSGYFLKEKRPELFHKWSEVVIGAFHKEFAHYNSTADDFNFAQNKTEATVYTAPNSDGFIPWGTPRGNRLNLLKSDAFISAFDSARGLPAWVAYRLSPPRYNQAYQRPDDDPFYADTDAAVVVHPDDYKYSGYDRGHMAPAYAISTRYGSDAVLETFKMSNIVPQLPNLNRRSWKNAELYLAKKFSSRQEATYIVCGPIFDSNRTFLNQSSLGRKIEIPDAFFMMAIGITGNTYETFSIVLPQTVDSTADYRDYAVSIDYIESKTGIDFYHELPDIEEDPMERKIPQIN